jgi:hypothetical protein
MGTTKAAAASTAPLSANKSDGPLGTAPGAHALCVQHRGEHRPQSAHCSTAPAGLASHPAPRQQYSQQRHASSTANSTTPAVQPTAPRQQYGRQRHASSTANSTTPAVRPTAPRLQDSQQPHACSTANSTTPAVQPTPQRLVVRRERPWAAHAEKCGRCPCFQHAQHTQQQLEGRAP